MQQSHAVDKAELVSQNQALEQGQRELLAEMQGLRNEIARRVSAPPIHAGWMTSDGMQFNPNDINECANTHNQRIKYRLEGAGIEVNNEQLAKRLFDSPGEMARINSLSQQPNWPGKTSSSSAIQPRKLPVHSPATTKSGTPPKSGPEASAQ